MQLVKMIFLNPMKSFLSLMKNSTLKYDITLYRLFTYNTYQEEAIARGTSD